eukprot:15429889-Alexandrium_andersonii.AAC.1
MSRLVADGLGPAASDEEDAGTDSSSSDEQGGGPVDVATCLGCDVKSTDMCPISDKNESPTLVRWARCRKKQVLKRGRSRR